MHYFSIFFKLINKPCVKFLRVWTKNTLLRNVEKILKIFDEISIEKLNFYFLKFVTKNRAFGNNTIFLQFFRFRGGGGISPSPLPTPSDLEVSMLVKEKLWMWIWINAILCFENNIMRKFFKVKQKPLLTGKFRFL